MNGQEIATLAAAANILRPDWPEPSLRTMLTNNHAQRTYHATAVALAWIATDPATRTPARLNQAGPWWVTPDSRPDPPAPPPKPCITCGRLHDPDRPEQHPRPASEPPAEYHAARAALRQPAQEPT